MIGFMIDLYYVQFYVEFEIEMIFCYLFTLLKYFSNIITIIWKNFDIKNDGQNFLIWDTLNETLFPGEFGE